MGIFDGIFRRNLDLKSSVDLDISLDVTERVYLKTIALETNINFLARTISQSQFWYMSDKKRVKNALDYRLNVAPNKNKSASNFWHRVIYKLIYDNEVLIIKSDSDDLLIADDFEHDESALYEDIFKNVQIGDYNYTRNFKMSEVIYLTYNNEKMTNYIEGLFRDYGELFGRVLDSELRNNQLRAMLNVASGGGNLSDENISRINKYVQSIYDKFKNDSIAIIPNLSGMELTELNKPTTTTDNSADKLQKLKKVFIEDVSKLIGIPPSLVHGEVPEMSSLVDAYLKFCVNPLNKSIEDELNKKLISESKYHQGDRIRVVGINRRDPLEHSEAIDKLVASGTYSRNEIREKFGDERLDGLDEMLITKNYTSASLEGGEEE